MIYSSTDTVSGSVSGSVAGSLVMLAGADPVGLALGMAAAVLTTFIHGGIDSRAKAFCGVLLAALLAGYGDPIAVEVLRVDYPEHAASIAKSGPLLSLLIGALSPTAIVAASNWLRRKGDSA